jgi:hypothetical protein
MAARLTFQMPPIELVQALKRNAATFFTTEPRGDLLPRPALLALFANEVHERFEAAAISASATSFHLPFTFGFRIHSPKFYGNEHGSR